MGCNQLYLIERARSGTDRGHKLIQPAVMLQSEYLELLKMQQEYCWHLINVVSSMWGCTNLRPYMVCRKPAHELCKQDVWNPLLLANSTFLHEQHITSCFLLHQSEQKSGENLSTAYNICS